MGKLERATLSVVEAGRLLGIGRHAAYAAAKRGELPSIRLGGRVVVPRAALERLLAEGRPQAAPPAGGRHVEGGRRDDE